MSKFYKLLALSLALCLVLGLFAGCDKEQEDENTWVDYVEQLKLDMSSATAKTEATVKNFVDGDTVHFYVTDSFFTGGILKARFLAINTPESTGKVEEWGKAASNFTKETLSQATSIILESDTDDGLWNADSTGSRYLVWIWYKTAEDEEYRNLNVEILQNGLALASATGSTRYGEIAQAALYQAEDFKLKIYSDEDDPDFYYGEAHEVTLKELRLNVADYEGSKVAFTGVITCNYNNGVYVEALDEETGLYFGMYVYYGYSMSGKAIEILSVGNEVRIVGTVSSYYGSWQVSGLSYNARDLTDANSIRLISEGNSGAYAEVDGTTYHGTVDLENRDEVVTVSCAEAILGTTVQMSNLLVTGGRHTDDEESSSYGAMTLTCKTEDGSIISVRTVVLTDANGDLITEDAYVGKTITVKGVADYYEYDGNGTYQIKVLSANGITVHE